MQLESAGASAGGPRKDSASGSSERGIAFSHPLLALSPQTGSDATGPTGLDLVVETFRRVLSCEAAAIRLADPDGSLPYTASVGFSRAAIEERAHAAGTPKPCVCAQVLNGSYDASLPCFSASGSFVINSVAERWAVTRLDSAPEFHHLLAGTPGFQSLIVTALRTPDHDLGVIQCADSHPDRFGPERVALIESAAVEIAQELFYDSLWQPSISDRAASVTRSLSVCPICGRQRQRSGTWRAVGLADHLQGVRTAGKARHVVCPSCMRLCNFE